MVPGSCGLMLPRYHLGTLVPVSDSTLKFEVEHHQLNDVAGNVTHKLRRCNSQCFAKKFTDYYGGWHYDYRDGSSERMLELNAVLLIIVFF